MQLAYKFGIHECNIVALNIAGYVCSCSMDGCFRSMDQTAMNDSAILFTHSSIARPLFSICHFTFHARSVLYLVSFHNSALQEHSASFSAKKAVWVTSVSGKRRTHLLINSKIHFNYYKFHCCIRQHWHLASIHRPLCGIHLPQNELREQSIDCSNMFIEYEPIDGSARIFGKKRIQSTFIWHRR